MLTSSICTNYTLKNHIYSLDVCFNKLKSGEISRFKSTGSNQHVKIMKFKNESEIYSFNTPWLKLCPVPLISEKNRIDPVEKEPEVLSPVSLRECNHFTEWPLLLKLLTRKIYILAILKSVCTVWGQTTNKIYLFQFT